MIVNSDFKHNSTVQQACLWAFFSPHSGNWKQKLQRFWGDFSEPGLLQKWDPLPAADYPVYQISWQLEIYERSERGALNREYDWECWGGC